MDIQGLASLKETVKRGEIDPLQRIQAAVGHDSIAGILVHSQKPEGSGIVHEIGITNLAIDDPPVQAKGGSGRILFLQRLTALVHDQQKPRRLVNGEDGLIIWSCQDDAGRRGGGSINRVYGLSQRVRSEVGGYYLIVGRGFTAVSSKERNKKKSDKNDGRTDQQIGWFPHLILFVR